MRLVQLDRCASSCRWLQSGDLKDLSFLIRGARDVIANAAGDCAKLLGQDALANLDRISNSIQFDPNLLVTTISPGGDQLRDESWANAPFVQGMTSDEDIYLNPNGWAFSKPGIRGGKPYYPPSLTSTFEKFGITQQQYAFAVVIHEFLHAIGKFKPDTWKVKADKSVRYQEEVLKKCFSAAK